MLNNKKINQENAIEKYFCEPFSKLTCFPMNKENTEYLIRLLMIDKIMELPEDEKPFLMKVIKKRLFSFSYKIDDERLHFFIAIISRTPGTAIMYLTYLQYLCKKHNYREIDLDKFCELFPAGFPSEEDLKKIWDLQKVARNKSGMGSDNLLDYPSAMISIR